MPDQPQNLRGLKALVGVMGVLIIVGSAVVVGTVVHRIYARMSAPPTAVPPLAAPVATGLPATALAPGEHIAGIAAAGSEVAIWANGPSGDRLLLLDPATGQIRQALSSAAVPVTK